MKWKRMAVFLMVVMMFSLTGCGERKQGNDFASGKNNRKTTLGGSESPESGDGEEEPVSGGNEEDGGSSHKAWEGGTIFDEKADLEGSVYEFRDTGFSLSPAEMKESGKGVEMSQSAPGAEDESKLVTVTYENDCIFTIVVMDALSLKEVSRETTTHESIKKQTQVMVYGSCRDTTHWMAEKVVIIRWQTDDE